MVDLPAPGVPDQPHHLARCDGQRQLAHLSPTGVAALLRLGVRTVIDLRCEEAARKSYPIRYGATRQVAYHQVDMIGDHYSFASDVCDAAWSDADEDSRYAALPLFSHLRDYCPLAR